MFPSPYVNDVTRGDLLLYTQRLRELSAIGFHGLDVDLQAVTLAFAESLTGEEVNNDGNSSNEADTDGTPGTEDEVESTSGDDPISMLLGPVKGIISTVALPAAATICDVFGGIIGETSNLRADTTHEHGHTTVRYAINNGQLPADSVFVAFYGPYYWKSDFILKHLNRF